MWLFYIKEIFFFNNRLIILFLLSLSQSFLSVAIAHNQTAFFEAFSVELLTVVTLWAYIIVLVSRGFLQFLKKSVQEFYIITSHQEWLVEWGQRLMSTSDVQRAQLIAYDLKQWLGFLFKQSSLFVEDLFQLVFFMPLLLKGIDTFGSRVMAPLLCYVIFLNLLTYLVQQQAIAIEQRKDRVEAYWHARLYRKKIISSSCLHRYQKMLFKIYIIKTMIDFFDTVQQVGLLILPLGILYNPLIEGVIKIQDYVLFSQIIYNLIPAMTHISVYRVNWAVGWSSGKRLYEALSSSSFSKQINKGELLLV